jgi:hypothetical protein
MIRFDRIPEPDGFDVEVRQRGKVDRRLERIEPTRFGEAEPHYRLFLDSTLTLAGLRRTAPDVGRAVDAELRRHT